MSSFNEYLTEAGKSLFASMAKGNQITFTRIVIGDGIMKPGQTEATMESVISPRCTLPVESVTKTKDNRVLVRANFKNSGAGSFYFREKGVYATIDGEKEHMVFYANNGAYAEWIDREGSQVIEKIIRTIVAFSDADNVNITINSSEYGPPTIETNYTTIEDFEKNNDVEVGTEVILPNGDIYIYTANGYVQIYGARIFVIMRQYIEPAKRRRGSLYLQLGKTRRLIIKIFIKYLRELVPEGGGEANTLYIKEGKERTNNEKSDGQYRFLCKNLDIMKNGEEPAERIHGNLYFKPDKK